MTNLANHTDRSHALCSASGAERWLACPGSVALSLKVPTPPTSKYAEEGTKAHELAETLLVPFVQHYNKNGGNSAPPGMPLGGMIRIKDFPKGAMIHDYPEEMKDYMEEYANIIWSDVRKHSPRKVCIEEKVVLDKELGMFGTADCFFAYRAGKKVILNIYDLKYGQGKVVEADSPQLIYYGLAVQASHPKVAFDEFHLHLYQPRAEHDDGPLRKHVITKNIAAQWLERFRRSAKKSLEIAARKTGVEDGEVVAGDHCGFCNAKPICRAYASYLNTQAGIDFTDEPAVLVPAIKEQRNEIRTFITDEQAARLLQHKAEIIKFFNALTEYGINRYQEGNAIPGTKVVAGRSNRKWKGTTAETEIGLKELGINDVWDKTLRGIGSVERELVQLGRKKKELPALLSKLTMKPKGSLSLVSESDPRPAITNADIASSDFTELDDSTEEG